jgi:hypothetical protein
MVTVRSYQPPYAFGRKLHRLRSAIRQGQGAALRRVPVRNDRLDRRRAAVLEVRQADSCGSVGVLEIPTGCWPGWQAPSPDAAGARQQRPVRPAAPETCDGQHCSWRRPYLCRWLRVSAQDTNGVALTRAVRQSTSASRPSGIFTRLRDPAGADRCPVKRRGAFTRTATGAGSCQPSGTLKTRVPQLRSLLVVWLDLGGTYSVASHAESDLSSGTAKE